MSFRSRKARVAGEWTVSAMEMTSDGSNSSTTTSAFGGSTGSGTNKGNSKFDGTNMTETSSWTSVSGSSNSSGSTTATGGSVTTTQVNNGVSGTPRTGTYSNTGSITMTFEKDGAYKSTTSFKKKIVYSPVAPSTTTTTQTEDEDETVEGTWAFIGKDKANEFKNKERIGIWYKSRTIKTTSTDNKTYTGGSDGATTVNTGTVSGKNSAPDEVWEIVQLKSKEMKIISNGEWNSSTTSNTTYTESPGVPQAASGGTGTNKNTFKMSATLTAK